MKKGFVVTLLLMVMVFTIYSSKQMVDASSLGRVGHSGNPATGADITCLNCHAGGTAPVAALAGPDTVMAGQTVTYTFTLTGRQDGPNDRAGFNVSATGGVISTVPDTTGTYISAGEITHQLPQNFADGENEVTFALQWTAPAISSTVTLYGAGVSADGDGGTGGDGVGLDQFTVNVIGPDGYTLYLPIIIYDEPPPPPEAPDSLQLVPFATGFNTSTVTGIVSAGDDRLFVLEREGVIRVVMADGTILPTPFLDIQDWVETGNWEEGLLGLVFHPDYAQNGYFYVYYTGANAIQGVVRRFTVSDNPNVANPDSTIRLMIIPKPYEVHNGGDMHFGPDGYLYIAVGQGGPDPFPQGHPEQIVGDPDNRAQRVDVVNGSIMRIDVNSQASVQPNPNRCALGTHYTIPADNPWANDGWDGTCDEIWAIGLRNPWRFSFDSLTGDMYIGDVGEWEYDEVNFLPAGAPGGANFGWRCFEGPLNYSTIWPEVADTCDYSTIPHTPPVISHPLHGYHGSPLNNCSLTGGFVYRGSQFPSLYGQYLFADLCSTHIWRVDVDNRDTLGWQEVSMGATGVPITTFGQDVNGELYVGGYNHSTIYKVVVP